MDRAFATSIEPIIATTLDLLEEIERRPAEWDLAQVKDYQNKIRTKFNAAEKDLKHLNETSWKHVKYALTAWIDEQCIAKPWQGSEWWKNNSLEVTFFRTKNSHNDFYVAAERAIRDNDRNAIEAFFLCVVLGFRGIYLDLRSENPEYQARASEFIQRKGLKSDIRAWLKRSSEFLPIGLTSRFHIKNTEGYGAPPMNGRADFVSAALFAIVSLAVFLGYLIFFSGLFEQLVHLFTKG